MRWLKTDNPRVWETPDGRYHALAEDSPFVEAGCIGRIYARPLQYSFFPTEADREGTAKWGADPEAALRQTIRRFDPAAELPPREKVLP